MRFVNVCKKKKKKEEEEEEKDVRLCGGTRDFVG
jgi:hypothetical protein